MSAVTTGSLESLDSQLAELEAEIKRRELHLRRAIMAQADAEIALIRARADAQALLQYRTDVAGRQSRASA